MPQATDVARARRRLELFVRWT